MDVVSPLVEREDDEGSWAEACAGDQRAFRVLFMRYYARVFRYVAVTSGGSVDADEVTAAAFLELWRLRTRVRLVNGSILPWLLLTSSNLARNQGRKVQRYRRLLAELPREDEAVDAGDVVADRDSAERRASALAAGLDRLAAKDAQLIAMTSQQDLSIAEAAAALGMSAGAARVRLHRARVRLRDLIELPEPHRPEGRTS